MISYFNSTSLKILLKSAIGYFEFCLFLYNNTPAMVCFEAKEKIIQSFEKSGLIKTGASVNAFLMSLKEFLASRVYLMSFPFLNIFVTFLKICAKLGINHIEKFTCPIIE